MEKKNSAGRVIKFRAWDKGNRRMLTVTQINFMRFSDGMLRGLLALQGVRIGRRHVKTLMKRMGVEALYRRPRTTKPEPGHKIHPYLLRGMEITRPNQVWAVDITYIPMARGFVYLAVVLDWATRRVLSWRLSITMQAAFCVETLEDALARHGKPEIFNTDQGSQFTGSAFTGLFASNGIASAWTARAHGATTSSSSGCGAASNTRKYTSEHTKPSARLAPRSATTSISTMAADRIRALTTPHQIKPTSPRCQSVWQPNQGRGSTYQGGKSVQTTGTSSHHHR
jgi:putative transposase